MATHAIAHWTHISQALLWICLLLYKLWETHSLPTGSEVLPTSWHLHWPRLEAPTASPGCLLERKDMMNGIWLGRIDRCILRVYLNIAMYIYSHTMPCMHVASSNHVMQWNILGYVGIRGGFNKRSTAIVANSHQLKIIPSSVRVGCSSGIVCRNCCKTVKKMLRPKRLHENPTDLDTAFFQAANV